MTERGKRQSEWGTERTRKTLVEDISEEHGSRNKIPDGIPLGLILSSLVRGKNFNNESYKSDTRSWYGKKTPRHNEPYKTPRCKLLMNDLLTTKLLSKS